MISLSEICLWAKKAHQGFRKVFRKSQWLSYSSKNVSGPFETLLRISPIARYMSYFSLISLCRNNSVSKSLIEIRSSPQDLKSLRNGWLDAIKSFIRFKSATRSGTRKFRSTSPRHPTSAKALHSCSVIIIDPQMCLMWIFPIIVTHRESTFLQGGAL